MDRREFLAKAGVVATWAAVAVRVGGCGDDGDGNPMDGDDGDVTGSVASSSGHTHAVSISAAQIDAANAVTLTLSNSAGHVHEVSLTADQVMDIGAGARVTAVSTNDSGHTHAVTFN